MPAGAGLPLLAAAAGGRRLRVSFDSAAAQGASGAGARENRRTDRLIRRRDSLKCAKLGSQPRGSPFRRRFVKRTLLTLAIVAFLAGVTASAHHSFEIGRAHV